MKNKLPNIITIGFVSLIGYIIYSANTGRHSNWFRLLHSIPFSDKLGHLILIGTLTFLINYSLKNKTLNLINKSVLLGSIIVFIGITIEEITQIWIPSRTFDYSDLACNYLGIILASLLNLKIRQPSR